MELIYDPLINIRGEKVALGPLRSDLLALYHRWMNDFEAGRTGSTRVGPNTIERASEFYRDFTRSQRDFQFLIYLPNDGTMSAARQWRPIGSAGLHHVNHTNRTAEFVILIGERDCWSKGYGTETARLLLDYGFNILALNNIMLYCFASNIAGIKAYERAGFKHIGTMHECAWVDGKTDDMVLMDALAREFGPSVVLEQVQPGGKR